VKTTRLLLLPLWFGLAGLAAAEDPAKLAPGDATALAAVHAAMKDQLEPKTPYRMDISTTLGEGKESKISGIVESSERKSMDVNLTGNKTTMIFYGQNVWRIKEGTPPMKMPENAAKQIIEMSKKMADPENINIGEAKALPGESLGGVSMNVFSYRMKMASADSVCTIWVNPQGQVVKQDSEGTALGKKSVTHTIYTYDPALKVVPPAP